MTSLINLVFGILFQFNSLTSQDNFRSESVDLSESVKLAKFVSKRLHTNFNRTTQFRKLEEEYKKEDFSFKEWDISSFIGDLAADIELKLARATKCLSDLRTRVQQLYKNEYQTANGNYETNKASPSISRMTARPIQDMRYSAQHDQNVSFTNTVFSTPVDVSINGTKVETDILWTKNLLKTFKQNFNKEQELLIWQYFCTENGVLRLYPATADFSQNAETVDYDCRFQPWYIDGDGCAKDIIILFDLSGSMVGWPLTLAQRTASQILKLMSDNDFLGFIGISNKPVYLRDNHNNTIELLNRATDKRKHDIDRRIQAVVPDDEANFDMAIQAAFEMFNNSKNANSSAKCQKILVVFSDGTIQNCADTFRERNPNKDVQVFSFACGKARTTTSGLKEMACDNRGNFLKIDELTDVNANTFKFFNLVNKNSNSRRGKFVPKWSNVYTEEKYAAHIMNSDSGGDSRAVDRKQMILSVSAPSFYQERKTGIVGIDIRISSLMSKVLRLSKAGLYGMIINNRGNLVYHPRLKPLHDLDQTYTARVAEAETCRGNVSAADIEREIVSGRKGVIEGECLYLYSLNMKRGREVYTKLKFYYTPISNYPFFIALVIPSAFSFQLHSSKNLTDIAGFFNSILSRSFNHPASVSVTGWFTETRDSTSSTERIRFNSLVLNETAAHYSVVGDIVAKAWPSSNEIITTPVILFTSSGLLLYNYPGWLEVRENSNKFTKNSRLVAALEGGRDLNVGPQRASSVAPQRNAFLVTRNIVLRQDLTDITPATIGTEIFEDVLQKVFALGKSGYEKKLQDQLSMLLDDKGFVIFIDPVRDSLDIIGQHLSAIYPEVMTRMLGKSIYSKDTYKNCIQICRTRADPTSSATSLGGALLLLYNTIALSSAHSQLGSTISLKREDTYYRCCKDYNVFKLNQLSRESVFKLVCDTCDKTLHSVPVKDTNLLLLNDLDPDCTCTPGSGEDRLKAQNTTSVFNVTFGSVAYSPLPCTNNINISTPCASRAARSKTAISCLFVVLIRVVLL